MNPFFNDLYEKFERELQAIRTKHIPDAEIVEQGFHCALQYWHQTTEWIKENDFRNKNEEIHFFKKVKPLFVGEIEYHVRLYQAIHFTSIGDVTEISDFLLREIRTIAKFHKDNAAFIHYMHSGDIARDEEYFLRQNHRGPTEWHPLTFGKETEFSTSHDHLVATMVAYEKYKSYLAGRLTSLLSDNE